MEEDRGSHDLKLCGILFRSIGANEAPKTSGFLSLFPGCNCPNTFGATIVHLEPRSSLVRLRCGGPLHDNGGDGSAQLHLRQA
eukprot:scaffold482_cov247-Pinguiococcus_pyrenoidosus.AAC.18